MKIYIVEAVTTSNYKSIKFFFDDETELNQFFEAKIEGIFNIISMETINVIEYSTDKIIF